MLVPPPEGGGELFGGDGSRDPFPLLLESAVVQGDACKLLLHAPEQEEISPHEVRRIGGVVEDLDVVGDEPILDDGGSVDRGIVPMKKLGLLSHHRPLLLEMPHEDVEDLHNVRGVDGGHPRDDMSIDEALAVEEGEQQLFASASLDLCLDWARQSLLDPLLGLLLALRHVVAHHRLVHRDNRVQHGERVAVDRLNELGTGLDTRCCFCSSFKSLGTHLADFFSRPKSSCSTA